MAEKESHGTSGGSLKTEKEHGTTGVEVRVQIPVSAQHDKANELLAELNKQIAPRKLAWINPQTDIILLEKNAHFMGKEMLDRLTANIKQDKFLSQIAFGIKLKAYEFKFHIISGNHRMQGAIKAGLERELLMYLEEEECTKEKALAIQLSHNAIKGSDDKDILLELYKELTDLNMKEYSAISESDIFANDFKQFPGINEELFDFMELRFMFTSGTLTNVDKILQKLEERAFSTENDRLVLTKYTDFVEIMTKIKTRCNIKNNTRAFLKMIEICEKELAKPQEKSQEVKKENKG